MVYYFEIRVNQIVRNGIEKAELRENKAEAFFLSSIFDILFMSLAEAESQTTAIRKLSAFRLSFESFLRTNTSLK